MTVSLYDIMPGYMYDSCMIVYCIGSIMYDCINSWQVDCLTLSASDLIFYSQGYVCITVYMYVGLTP